MSISKFLGIYGKGVEFLGESLGGIIARLGNRISSLHYKKGIQDYVGDHHLGKLLRVIYVPKRR